MTRRAIEFTTAQVALLTGVSEITVRKWISRGHIRRNAHGRIDGERLLAYLDERGTRGQHTNRRGLAAPLRP